MYADYHVHTEFSGDSWETMESQVRKAVELGLEEICFTDHVDYGIKKDWADGNVEWLEDGGILYSLTNVDYPRYFEELSRLKEKYADKIVIKQGLEFGVQSITISDFERLWERYGDRLDFTLLSMHQVDNLEFWNQEFQNGRGQKEYNERYYQEILKVIKQFKHYSVLAHLDLIVRYDEQGIYPFENVRDIVTEILKTVIADGKGIELNTSSWHYGLNDTQPSIEILKLYKELGGKIITVGSDAHSTEYLADHFSDAYDVLRDLGYTEIYTFDRMKPICHDL